jgi:hypothetical protein
MLIAASQLDEAITIAPAWYHPHYLPEMVQRMALRGTVAYNIIKVNLLLVTVFENVLVVLDQYGGSAGCLRRNKE